MSRQAVGLGGIALAGGAAYYLYNAGGDPKLAEKKLEHDAASAAARVRSEVPGRGKEARKAGEEGFETVRAKAQDLSAQARAEADRAGQKFEGYRQDAEKKLGEARQEANQAINKFDKQVTEKASESKSWFSGWFGGK